MVKKTSEECEEKETKIIEHLTGPPLTITIGFSVIVGIIVLVALYKVHKRKIKYLFNKKIKKL
jgi:hypothetical protein